MQGLVIKSTGKTCMVLTDDGVKECVVKGNFRIRGIRTTNPVAVGDKVTVIDSSDEIAKIVDIAPRENYIIRKAANLSKESHIIAANVDQAMVIATLKEPRTSTGFIDRFLVTCEAYRIDPTIVFNKSDLLSHKEKEKQSDLLNAYQSIGYKIMVTSAITGEGIEELINFLKKKTTLLAGHSGVGKSTILNRIDPKLNIRTGDISESYQKGQHTTTFAEMHFLEGDIRIIDTPGIKEFGIIDIKREELSHFFPEIFELLPECRFSNCTHVNEPSCAVVEAVKNGEVPDFRYINYLNILESIPEKEEY